MKFLVLRPGKVLGWHLLLDSQVRTAILLWILIAGIFVFIANVIAASVE